MNSPEIVDRQEALDRFTLLTAIPGRSGEERDVAEAIIDQLVSAGLDPECCQFDGADERTELKGDCGNLVVKLPGGGPGPHVLLSAHMDTVPICLGSKPVIEGDSVTSSAATGLGADDRSGCAAILTAAIERICQEDSSLPPATLLFTVQEEIGLKGAQALDASLIGKVDLAFNFDGGSVNKITTGAIGGERIDITLKGLPAHAGVAPETGISAIVIAAKAIAVLEQEGWLGRVKQPDGEGTANVGIFHGGDATNVITPEVKLRAEARSHDSAFRTKIVETMKQAFQWAAAETRNDAGNSGICEFKSRVDYDSFALPEDDPSILELESMLKAMGREPYRMLAGGGLDANWLNHHGVPAVTVGCGQQNIHTDKETLDVNDYIAACQIATQLLCGKSK
ncbi:M20/M25/M40 family metallo-hydrolase [Roseiconus lacunae]|uniref:M20/M25/M40 family metallo-hydrolase n=1 Tax=Roseiconus lacunae TaxID=2605694 RepID=A0ABT7PKT6_9BACT|nr:M20/M25/M40 family metallo-hydrolase [Roseiconus lacunae]MCD0460727.1 M20/M25/M40 family metallo-hydrolase [Roseiconus lacunae]MDM4017080.1 M20/M25/M40 family metallo-hydrolase [Roseiconus lacunae]WRQ51339.1 M20/M25/M40 family metallo-hydrolase [Stieleria sp. HD01]